MAEALLTARGALFEQWQKLEKRLRSLAREDERVRRLMTAPGVGTIVALTYASAIDDPARFRSSKAVGAHFGLTPKKYQSGETDVTGRISKIGDGGVRTALYEAANVILTRPVKGSTLKSWGMRLATEWKSTALRAYQRRTKRADSLIAGAYLAGTNTRRVRRALSAVFGGAVSKDTVSRVWQKVKGDWDAWNARSLAEEPIIRVILDGTVVRVRLDRKATSIVLLVVLGVRDDGQKVLLAVKNMGGETSEAWRAVLDDLVRRGLHKPEFLIVDGGSGLEQALVALWGDVPTQRCTVHKHRNLLAHAPQRLHEEVSADYNDMIYAASAAEIEERRRAFIRKWRLKCTAVADSLEEAAYGTPFVDATGLIAAVRDIEGQVDPTRLMRLTVPA